VHHSPWCRIENACVKEIKKLPLSQITNKNMTVHLKKAKRVLQNLKPSLVNNYHVDSIGLFGSIVRKDFLPETSDVDIVVSFTQPIGIEFIDLADLLEKEFKRKVDVVSLNGVKEKYFKEIEKDIVYV
jgi:predicted nucleotidyltransferase